MENAIAPIETIRNGRAIGEQTIGRRRDQQRYVQQRARERRAREANPGRELSPLEQRALARFGFDDAEEPGDEPA